MLLARAHILKCFMLYHPCLVSTGLLSVHLVTILMFLVSFMSLFGSRCTLELKFAIYHRVTSLSSQVSSVDVCSIDCRMTDQAFNCSNTESTMAWLNDKTSPCLHAHCLPVSMHTDRISNSVILSNGYVSLLRKWFVCICTSEENGIQNETMSFWVTGFKCSKLWKTDWVMHHSV